jgi:hypothetical protein
MPNHTEVLERLYLCIVVGCCWLIVAPAVWSTVETVPESTEKQLSTLSIVSNQILVLGVSRNNCTRVISTPYSSTPSTRTQQQAHTKAQQQQKQQQQCQKRQRGTTTKTNKQYHDDSRGPLRMTAKDMEKDH